MVLCDLECVYVYDRYICKYGPVFKDVGRMSECFLQHWLSLCGGTAAPALAACASVSSDFTG